MFSKERILKELKYKPLTFKYLARKLNIPMDKNREFSKFLFELERSGDIKQTREKVFYVPKYLGASSGIIRINNKGFGFIDAEDDSYFIPAPNLNTAMDGDEVEFQYFVEPESKRGFVGSVSKVLKRNKLEFVGRVIKTKYGLTIKPFDPRIRGIFVFDDSSKFSIDQEVKVKIKEFKGNKLILELVKVLGHKNDVSMDILIAIEDSGVPYKFLDNTNKEADSIPDSIDQEDTTGREDLRKKLIITIDGDDTKDFDDAIEVIKLPNGNYELGVHIADVTHYVKENKPLDDEAKERGTSIYLADRVIPMLPPKLSNGICSLNPNVDRFTLSATMEIDPEGNTVSHKLYPSIINSKYRLTYKEVNDFYEGKKSFEDKDLTLMLKDALDLSHIIRKYKQKEGYIDFEIDEAKIIINEKGETTSIEVRERGESEMLIEDFMVRANETVAKHAFDLKKPFIYRIHAKPDQEKIDQLQGVVDILGLNVKIPHNGDPKAFAKAVETIKSSRFDDFMKIMMLRTMSKAEYSQNNIGHFGLASKEYTHFTSPIRRYPDLMVHRMIREYFFNNEPLEQHFKTILSDIAKSSSEAEQVAVSLERKVADIKKAEFYEQFVNKEAMDAKIVSVMKFGLFVEFPNKVSALLHVTNLLDGKYDLDKSGFKLTNGSRTFTIGDPIVVKVIGTNKSEGRIDVVLAEQYESWVKQSQEKPKYNKNKKR